MDGLKGMTWERFEKLKDWQVTAIISVWMLVLLLPGIFQLPLLDRDEPRFSRATVEMMERSDWIVPTFNGEYRFDKPPLTYWWMAVNYRIFGFNEFGARLHAVVSSIGVGLLLFFWVRKRYGIGVAVGSVVGWSICLQNLMHGRLALADMPMILMLAVTHMALWQRLNKSETRRFDRNFLILYGSMGVGFLAKGPIAVFFPVITVLCYKYLFRRQLKFSSLHVVSGLLMSLAIVAGWGIPALMSTGGAYWDEGMGTHVIDRGFKSFNDRIIIPGFYIPASLLSLFPVFPVVVAGVIGAVRRRDDMDAFLLSWAIGPFLIFSFYATQLIHYTLPAFPALMILGFREMNEARGKYTGIWHRIYLWIILFAGLAAALFGIYISQMSVPGEAPAFAASGRELFSVYLIDIGVVVLSLTGVWYFYWWKNQVAGMLVCAFILGGAMIHAGHHSKTWGLSRKIGAALENYSGQEKPAAIGYREPSLVFYANRIWDMSRSDSHIDLSPDQPLVIKRSEIQLEDFIKGVFVGFDKVRGERITDSALQQVLGTMRSQNDPNSDTGIQFIQGLNFARMSLVEVAVVTDPAQLIIELNQTTPVPNE